MPMKSSSFTMAALRRQNSSGLLRTFSLRSLGLPFGDNDDDDGDTRKHDTSESSCDSSDDDEALLHFWNELTKGRASNDGDSNGDENNKPKDGGEDYDEDSDLEDTEVPLRDSIENASRVSGRSLLSQHWCASAMRLSESFQSIVSVEYTREPQAGDGAILPCKSIDEARDAAIGAIFDRLDLDNDGLLDRRDLEAMLLDAAQTIKLKVDAAVIDAAIDALIEDAESEEALQSLEVSYMIGDYNTNRHQSSLACCDALDSINKAQFSDIFKRHPDMLRAFQDYVAPPANKKRESRTLTDQERRVEQEENEQIWQTRWKNWNVTVFWLGVYALATVAAFTTKAYKYSQHEEAQAVFGQCIVVARGAAQCLNLNCTLVLLPMARHFITKLRATRARFYFPFDAILDVHKLLGAAILFWTLVHVGAHMCDFHRLAHADEEDIFDLVGDKLGNDIPEDPEDRWAMMLSTRAGVTGVIMVLCILIAYPFILYRRRYFNAFWTTHHLLLVMLIALCIHGTGCLLENCQTVFWLMIPLALYFVPRFLRETSCSRTPVIDAKVKRGGVLCLRLQKPSTWQSTLQSGMYAFINVPAVSRYEWHPFTLTSSKNDPYIEFHISNAGDFTDALHNHVQSLDTREDLGKSFADGMCLGELSQDTMMTGGEDSAHSRVNTATNAVEEGSGHDDLDGPAFIDASMMHTKSTRRHCDFAPPDAIRDMVVKVEGPIGASSQGFKDYPILVLVGAGIGVTPMISVLKDLVDNPGKMQRVFFYWTVRDRAAFEWFSDLMDKVYKKDKAHILQVRHFLTSVKDDDRDIGAVLLHHATRAKHRANGFDLILGQQTHHQVEVGRPNWRDELKSVKQEAKDLGHNNCGIFLCGPERMAEALAGVSSKFSRSDPDFHFHFNKETF